MNKNIFGRTKPGFKELIFIILLLLLLLPGMQNHLRMVQETPLSGKFKETSKPDLDSLSWKSWLEGSFQEDLDLRIEQNIGFRNTLIRLNNQLAYSLYHKANAEGTVVGLEHEIFEEDYIKEYLGEYFIGENTWSKKVAKLRYIQDTLAKINKTLVIILEPDKASFYPEKLPFKYRQIEKRLNNYDCFSRLLKESKVNSLDLNVYFSEIKNDVEYPLFPQCGTHWSYYGATFAADTALHYLENLTGMELIDISISKNVIPEEPRHPDYDIGLAMNLMFPIPHKLTPDPVIEFNRTKNTKTPSVLIIGDSFYFNWLNLGIPAKAFSSCDFWYYNKKVTKSDRIQAGDVSSLDFKNEVLKNDIIILMVTSRMLPKFAWNFEEQLYSLFKPGYNDKTEYFANLIRAYDEHFKKLVNDAKVKGISLEERINKEAEYLLYKDQEAHPEKYNTREDKIRQITNAIRNSPDWLANVRQKAKKNGVSVDEQIKMDAEWMYKQKSGK